MTRESLVTVKEPDAPLPFTSPRITVPLPLVLEDESRWPEVVELLQRADAQRVMLYFPSSPVGGNTIRHYRDRLGSAAEVDPLLLRLAMDLRFYELWAQLLAERIALFGQAGIAVGIWGIPFGHGSGFDGPHGHIDNPPFTISANERGEEEPLVFCPCDPAFRNYLAKAYAMLAKAGPEVILLDDDFRLWRKGKIRHGCFCPLHLAEFRRRGGPDLPASEIARQVFTGAPGPLRDLWWSVQEDSLLAVATDLRAAINAVAPQVRLGYCVAPSSWEEASVPKLLQAFAGKTRPFMRTSGAPYWIHAPWSLSCEVEFVRLQRSWVQALVPDTEALCEGDTYPHVRSRCSATVLHAYHQVLHASGARQILSYVLPYTSPPSFEMGYVEMMERMRPHHQALLGLMPDDARDAGVSIPWQPGLLRQTEMRSASDTDSNSNDPIVHKVFARLGIPIAYDADSGPVVLSSHQARFVSETDIRAWSARGLVLDAPAAAELLARGIRCAATSVERCQPAAFELFGNDELNGRFAGGQVGMKSGGDIYFRLTPAPGARTLSTLTQSNYQALGPAVLVHETAEGHRTAVLGWDMRGSFGESMLMWNAARQEQFQRILSWVGKIPLPACSAGQPNLHVMVRRSCSTPGVGRIMVTLLNGSYDRLVSPEVRLDPRMVQGKQTRLLRDGATSLETFEAPLIADAPWVRLALPVELPALGFCAWVMDRP
ncbi:MAG: hypothetical protein ACYC26_01305 [Phycisphaerales bacterium]